MGLLRSSYLLILVFGIWVFLSTIIPNVLPTEKVSLLDVDGYLKSGFYNGINAPSIVNNGLTNKHIVLFTAHPDDESMFFTPSILELQKANYNNKIHLICLSNGGYDGLGAVRVTELEKAANLLNLSSWKVLDYKDSIKIYWETSDVVNTIKSELKKLQNEHSINNKDVVLLSFDEDGVSNHPNHKSVFMAIQQYALQYKVKAYKLKSWKIFIKYSSFLVTNIELMIKWLSNSKFLIEKLESYDIHIAEYLPSQPKDASLILYSDLNSLFLNFSTMTWAHYSQMVWFRWIWVFSSKYMNSNELVPIL